MLTIYFILMTINLTSACQIQAQNSRIPCYRRTPPIFRPPAFISCSSTQSTQPSFLVRTISRRTKLFHSSPTSSSSDKSSSLGQQPSQKSKCTWITKEQYEPIENDLSKEVKSQLFDVVLYNNEEVVHDNHDDAKSEGDITNLVPSHYRYRQTLNNATTIPTSILLDESTTKYPKETKQVIEKAQIVTERMYRWCEHIVASPELKLCPWATSSLWNEQNNAIRIKIVPQSAGWEGFEMIIRESAIEFLDLTGDMRSIEGDDDDDDDVRVKGEKRYENSSIVDPNIGITFIVAMPSNNLKGCDASIETYGPDDEYDDLFDFASFYNFALDLEDQLLDDIDEVTIAPFHPRWSFASSSSLEEQALDYEKKTPFPTVSIVRASAIEKAGEEVTAKIGVHNEEVLKKMGVHLLNDLFKREVWKESCD